LESITKKMRGKELCRQKSEDLRSGRSHSSQEAPRFFKRFSRPRKRWLAFSEKGEHKFLTDGPAPRKGKTRELPGRQGKGGDSQTSNVGRRKVVR